MTRTALYHLYASYVLKNAGIVYDEKNFFQLDSRIDAIKKALNLGSDQDLLKLLQQAPLKPEVHLLMIDTATNNETFFYRDAKVFTALEKTIFAKFENAAGPAIKVWSLACSSGQEACSILMAHSKYSKTGKKNIEIEASDISTKILEKAKSGIYTQLEVQRGLPITDLVTFFEQHGDQAWKMKPEIHSKISFSRFNMLKDVFPQNKYHIVFCRNVLIYQNIAQRKEIIQSILSALLPGGYLVMGNSENLLSLSNQYEQENLDGCAFYRKPDGAAVKAA